MSRRLTEQRRAFTLRVFEAKESAGAIYFSIYRCKSLVVATALASRLLTNDNVQDLLGELRQKAEDESVADVLEMKQILTEVMRGRFADFMTNLTPEKLKSAALQEIRVTEKDGGKTTTIKLHNPMQAIDQLAKLMGLYGKDGPLIDARSIHFGDEEGHDPKRALISLLDGIAARVREDEVDREPDTGADGGSEV